MALIRGLVVDAAGRPVAMAAVYVVSAPAAHPDVGQLSGTDGTFVQAAPTAGRYVLGARSDAAGVGTATADLGSAADEEVHVRITLAKGG